MATGVIDDIYNNASAVYSYASLNHFAGAAGDDEMAWVRHAIMGCLGMLIGCLGRRNGMGETRRFMDKPYT